VRVFNGFLLVFIPKWVYAEFVMKRAFPEKPLHWVGSAKDDLLEFPDVVVDDFGYALYLVSGGSRRLRKMTR